MERVLKFEVPAKDPIKLQGFYKNVFGWKFSKWDGPMDYWNISTGKNKPGIDGGMEKITGRVKSIVNVIKVRNLDSTIKKIKSNGGILNTEKVTVPSMGYMVYFQDPDRNVFGAFQQDKQAN